MKNERLITSAIIAVMATITAASICVDICVCRRPASVIRTSDTVTVVKVDTITETRYICRDVTRTVTDTVTLTTTEHDTVTVEVPIEYRYEKYDNALVLYHGYMAGIDSLITYSTTTEKTVTLHETVTRQPYFVIGPSITAGIGTDGKPAIVAGVSATFNIGSLKNIIK